MRQALRVLLRASNAHGDRSQSAQNSTQSTRRSSVAEAAIVASEASRPYFNVPDTLWLASKDLAVALCPGPQIVVADEIDVALARALELSPPSLVILTGTHEDPDALQHALRRAGTELLGPEARVFSGPGKVIGVAHETETLESLRQHRLASDLGLSFCPTPPWLGMWLDATAREDRPVVGTVSLTGHSASSALAIRRDDTLVPVGAPGLELETPRRADWEAAALAHELELYTGPVFPLPQVILAAHALQTSPPRDLRPAETPTHAEADPLWLQAARAADGARKFRDPSPASTPPLEGVDGASLWLASQVQHYRSRAERMATAAELSALPGEESGPRDREDLAILSELESAGLRRGREVIRAAGEVLSDHESKVVLRGFGFCVTRQAVANSASGAAQFADRLGYPVVLKALAPGLRRKSELGAVVLDLSNAASVRRAYAHVVQRVESGDPAARLDGVVVSEQIEAGLELQAGLFGLGGGRFVVYARAVTASTNPAPVALLGPLGTERAQLMAHAILESAPQPAYRRQEDPTPDSLSLLLQRISALGCELGDRLERLDLNPLRYRAERGEWVVLDAALEQQPHLEGD